jgi:NADH-quinone oxidoreductase subunit K
MISIHHYMILSTLLFTLGVVGVVSRRNFFIIYMSIELMLNAANLALVALGRHYQNLDGSVMAIIVIAIAAAEAAIFLVAVILLFKHKKSVDVDLFTLLRRGDIH